VTSGSDGSIDRFNIRQNTAASVPAAMQWDELRIGTSWASVTPAYVTPPIGFSITATPALISTAPGRGVSYVVNVAGQPGFSADVALSMQNLPSGVSASFSQGVIHVAGSSTVDVSIGSQAANGSYPLTIAGTTSLLTNQTTAMLLLKPPVTVVGDNVYGQTNVPANLPWDMLAVSVGEYHVLALARTGPIFAWGANANGQCNVPSDATNGLAIAAGGYHSLLLKQNGTVECWGANDYSQLTVPPLATNVATIAAGTWHSLALRADGKVFAWGDNAFGQSSVPGTLSNVVAIAAGGEHSLALQADGTVVAWGRNLGPFGDYAGQSDVPPDLSNVVAIAAGGYHSLALKSDGTLMAWGDNSSGQISVPAGLGKLSAIAAGESHSVAMRSDGSLVAWGDNFSGQGSFDVTLRGVTAIAAGGFDTASLIGSPPVAPLLAAQSSTSGSGAFSWPSIAGKVYVVEYKDTLSASNWSWGGAVLGSGNARQLPPLPAGKTQRFYRLRSQ
jgi:hypothetical protein